MVRPERLAIGLPAAGRKFRQASGAFGHTIAAVLLAIVASAGPARAVVVFKKGSTQPIAGHLVRESDFEIVLRQRQADGGTLELAISKSEVEDIVHTVDPERLGALDPARPEDYREYADELAEKKLDPEARDAALRLYVIAARAARDSATDSQKKIGPAAMLGLISLARTPEEETRFRAAAYLADPRHDPGLLQPAASLAAADGASDRAAKEKLLEVVHLARRGKGDVAARLIERPDVAPEFARAAAIVTKSDFQRICRAKELDGGQLRVLLKLELALLSALAPPETNAAEGDGASRWWSRLVAKSQPAIPPISLEYLTEFDPAKCVFRDGKWVER